MIPQSTRTLPAQRIMAELARRFLRANIARRAGEWLSRNELARRFLRANIASAARIPGLHASNRHA